MAAKALLMITIVRGLYYPSYIGDYNNPRTGHVLLNQPGFNGMIEGFISHCSNNSPMENGVLNSKQDLGLWDL